VALPVPALPVPALQVPISAAAAASGGVGRWLDPPGL